MDYNKFTYYRANPFANQGFIPTVALNNRTKASFPSEMPMGEEHLGKIGKKFYANGKQSSLIQNQHLLESPERYPFENRIALDKNYERNLKTIDIEGASSGSLMTQGMRNKLKARQQLLRRKKMAQGLQLDEYQPSEFTEEEKRRQIALQQYRRKQSLQGNTNALGAQNNGHNHHRYPSDSLSNQHQIYSQELETRPSSKKNNLASNSRAYQSISVEKFPQTERDKRFQSLNQEADFFPTVSESQIYRAGRNLLQN